MSQDEQFDPFHIAQEFPTLVHHTQESAVAALDQHFEADKKKRQLLQQERGEGVSADGLLQQMQDDEKKMVERAMRLLSAANEVTKKPVVPAEEKRPDGKARRFPAPPIAK